MVGEFVGFRKRTLVKIAKPVGKRYEHDQEHNIRMIYIELELLTESHHNHTQSHNNT
jgi:hypothetical protein